MGSDGLKMSMYGKSWLNPQEKAGLLKNVLKVCNMTFALVLHLIGDLYIIVKAIVPIEGTSVVLSLVEVL